MASITKKNLSNLHKNKKLNRNKNPQIIKKKFK